MFLTFEQKSHGKIFKEITNGFETNSNSASISNRDTGKGLTEDGNCPPSFGRSVNPIPSREQIMPTSLIYLPPPPQILAGTPALTKD